MDVKKKDRIVLICCLAAIVVSIGIGFLESKVFSSLFSTTDVIDEAGVVIDGNFVDNNINNALYSPLVARVGDKLYVSLYPRGIYEISESGSKRLSSDCGEVAVVDGELYAWVSSGLKHIDAAEGKLVAQTELDNLYSIRSGDVYIDYIIEQVGIASEKHTAQFMYKGETVHTVESEHSLYYYIDNETNSIFYTTSENELRRFDFSDNSDWLVYQFGEAYPESLIVEDGVLFISVQDNEISSVCYFDLDSLDIVPTTIAESDEYYLTFNAYGGNVYIVSGPNLIKYDISSGEKQVIATKTNIYHCYIVDDKWVYFIDVNSPEDADELWRVTQDGSIIEKVMD